MSPITKIPPCGARRVQPNRSDSEAVIAEPTIIEGITRIGSAAANGMAPSVINEAPITQFACPARRSAGVKSLPRMAVASARASGGGMPAAITAPLRAQGPAEGPDHQTPYERVDQDRHDPAEPAGQFDLFEPHDHGPGQEPGGDAAQEAGP